ncbi:hypothetical protein [Treponema primitia]|uniref:hypothetical protein n=1 Tax=Treponema primitia TaxID=88058 RepID=UPI0002555843|nr:hypothetical protein [Treponema primitia]
MPFKKPVGIFWRLFLLSLGFVSCTAYKEPAGIALYGAGDGAVLYALSKESLSGRISLAKPQKLSYVLEGAGAGGENLSLELDYRFPNELATEYQITLEINENTAWLLPLDASFLGIETVPGRIRYGIPLASDPIHTITVTLEKKDDAKTLSPGEDFWFELTALGIIKRWYGFAMEETALSATPFVFYDPQDDALRIDPLKPYRIKGRTELQTVLGEDSGGNIGYRVEAATVSYEWNFQKTERIFIPWGVFPDDPYPLRISGKPTASLRLGIAVNRPFPAEPVTADPGFILAYSRAAWRDPRFELFRWDRFPSILIFDTADYAVQDRMLKRLAFFTEKTGFRGRLAPDAEIADLHGWNAHDYRAEDLARFFEAARAQNFPLLPEERELEAILLHAGIIVLNNSGYTSGKGAIIAISRESPDYLRNLFMAHEGFHGLFFIDEDFRDFSRRRWDTLPRTAKRFILSYFDFQHYDMADSYLMVNEFMAHCLQQPASLAPRYFGETLAGRINESTWRYTVLPPQDEATGTWPELAAAFSAEANAFSSYVNRRWGLAGGRTWIVTTR